MAYDEMKKKTFYYVIVNEKSGKMLLQDCKCPIYWSLSAAQNRCNLFSGFKVIKVPAGPFNDLISASAGNGA